MKRQSVFNLTIILLRFFQGLCFLGIGLLLYDLIAFSIDPSHSFVRWEWYMEEALPIAQGEEAYPQQSAISYYSNWIQVLIQLLLMLLVWQNLIRILRSVASLKTFITENAQYFIKVRNLLLVIWLLNIFHFFQALGSAVQFRMNMALPILLFALAAHILALVFREGQRLADEQKLIV